MFTFFISFLGGNLAVIVVFGFNSNLISFFSNNSKSGPFYERAIEFLDKYNIVSNKTTASVYEIILEISFKL